MLKKIFFIILALCTIWIIIQCDTNEPPINSTISIKLEDVSCTEVWITLTTANLQLPKTVELKQNDQTISIINLIKPDTLFYVDSLLPNQNYQYQASSIEYPTTSNELSVTTMDTTCHDFTWQTYEFGEIIYQNHLFDVAIIDENNIWAVGYIYVADTSQNGYTMYNAVHWDGIDWELMRIPYLFQGDSFYNPIYAVFAFNSDDIWFGIGNLIHWDGTKYWSIGIATVFPSLVNKICGSDSNNLYVVGNNGKIAWYNGTRWTRIESGTDLSLYDMAVNDLGQIFICGGNLSFAKGIIIKSTDGNNFATFVEGANIPESELFNPNLYGSFSSIWFDQDNTLYSGGNILFQYKFNKWEYVTSLPENFIGGNPGTYYRGYITKVRGNSSNDMWIAGDRNTLRHFNGITWQQIGMPYDPQIDLVWRGIACSHNNVIVVGTHDRKAIIMMMKR